MVKDLTKGKPLGLILGFSVPIILGNLVQQAYSWADTMMVGKILGNSALSSVGSTGAITFLIIGFLIGIAEGSCLMVSRYFGAGDKNTMRRCVGNVIYVCLAITLLLTVFAVIFNRRILTVMSTPADIIDGAADYLGVIYIGMMASMLYNVCAGVMRALGDSRSPLYFLILSAILNLILNYLFMVVIPMGIKGAAVATVISQLFSGLASIVYIRLKLEDLRLSKDDLRPRGAFIGKICALSLPMAFQYSITAIGSIFLQTAINGIGSEAVTAFTVGDKVWNFGWSAINCVGVALAGFCSQNIGAAKPERAKKIVRVAWVFSVALTVFFMILYVTLGKQLFMIFSDDPLVHGMSHEFIKAILWMFPAFAVMRGSGAFIQGIGNAKLSMVLALLDGVVLRIGLSWLFGIYFGWGFYGFVLGYGLAPYGYAIPSMIYFLAGRWQKRRTLAEDI